MNWEKLFYLQSELDDHIEKEHPIKAGENRLSKKHWMNRDDQPGMARKM